VLTDDNGVCINVPKKLTANYPNKKQTNYTIRGQSPSGEASISSGNPQIPTFYGTERLITIFNFVHLPCNYITNLKLNTNMLHSILYTIFEPQTDFKNCNI